MNDFDSLVRYTVAIYIETLEDSLNEGFDAMEGEIAQIEEEQGAPYIRGNGYNAWCQAIEAEAEQEAEIVSWDYFSNAMANSGYVEYYIEELYNTDVLSAVWSARYGNRN